MNKINKTTKYFQGNYNILIIVFCIICAIFFCEQNYDLKIYAINYYAKITNENIYLYRKDIDDESVNNLYFKLPYSYFVILTGESGKYYKATYLGIDGYIKKEDIKGCIGTPVNAFEKNRSLRILSSQSQQLRDCPNLNNGINGLIYTLPLYEQNIQIIGEIEGEEVVSKRGNIWYYSKYIANNKTYYGYIYSGLCDLITPTTINNENYEELDNLIFVNSSETKSSNLGIELPKNNELIIISILSIPTFILFILVLKKPKTKNFDNNLMNLDKINIDSTSGIVVKDKKKKKAEKGKDYFEIE
jgi:hypothetical protein